jgi:hypothetical protein
LHGTTAADAAAMREVKIFCPKCKWVPAPSDRWICQPACGCLWNTFETCGVCPKCGKNWEVTQCLACKRRSRHIDWYHEFNPGEKERVEVEAA